MFNLYNAEQKIKAEETRIEQEKKQQLWDRWKEQNNPKWIESYQTRIKRFIFDVFYKQVYSFFKGR